MLSKKKKHFPVVAIVGRANVGKSTLWNRLIESQRAIVSKVPHTTRDRNFGLAIWRGTAIEVVDTGGLDAEQGSEIGRGILQQAELAIAEADIVLCVVDAESGVLIQDNDLARHLQKLNKRVILVANKIDHPKKMSMASTKEMFKLGLGEAQSISAATGRGVGDLLDVVYEELARMNRQPQPIEVEEGIRLVIMGRPNVGKSSLMNAILGEERVIVSPVAHTTREPQDTSFEWRGEKIILVDTAGMRQRAKVDRGIEEAGVEQNKKALTKADIALLVLDATKGPSSQDKHLAGLLKDAGRGVILIANKWDLVEDKQTMSTKEYEMDIRRAFPFLVWAPMIFVSAKTGLRANKVLDLAFKIREERRRKITYNALQRFLKNSIGHQKPLPDSGPKAPRIYDAVQLGINPPSFKINVIGDKVGLSTSWLRYFENRLREKFGFEGTPIFVKTRGIATPKDDTQSQVKKPKAKKPWGRKKRPIGRKGARY
ncbi:MAG: ribosome biogenesis GTPase Der [Patescibacteria group bacterium]|nr:ribosome biogenesis GTPase Der [Patescibacteria group bacterium]MBU2508964.1 ribosome biogenesis GTPase Der [Patescibacteria group bacterium]